MHQSVGTGRLAPSASASLCASSLAQWDKGRDLWRRDEKDTAECSALQPGTGHDHHVCPKSAGERRAWRTIAAGADMKHRPVQSA